MAVCLERSPFHIDIFSALRLPGLLSILDEAKIFHAVTLPLQRRGNRQNPFAPGGVYVPSFALSLPKRPLPCISTLTDPKVNVDLPSQNLKDVASRTTAVPLRDGGCTTESPAVDVLFPPSRPVPTPCRGRGYPDKPCAPLPFGLTDSTDDGIGFPPDDLGTHLTLLDQAAATSSEWAFLAVTLLEALEEHEAAKLRPPPATGVEALPLSLEVLIPGERWVAPVPPAPADEFTLTALLAPLVADPLQQISIGTTPLHFSWQEALAFFGAPCELCPWDRVSAGFAGHHPPEWGNMADFLAAIQEGGNSSRDIVWCYTDGSFTPPTTSSPCRMGWATVFVQPALRAVHCAWGGIPTALQDSPDSGSAFVAECYALLVGALIAVNQYSRLCMHFLSDCQSALAIVSGNAAWAEGGIAEAAAGAHSLRRMTASASDTYARPPGRPSQ